MTNTYYKQNVLKIDVSTPKFPNSYMLIEKEDYEKLQALGINAIGMWASKNDLYTAATINGAFHLVHRLIYPNSKLVDHKNHIGWDNTRENIRPCTRSQNMMNRCRFSNNTSGVTGISWHTHKKKWDVRIQVDNKQNHLGSFASKSEAIKIRRIAERMLFGKFAYTGG